MVAPYHNKALPSGAILREWRLEEVLGVGGFGIVYRGRGLYFNELVAIKEYFPGSISDRIDDTTVAPNDSDSEELYAFGLQKFVEEAKVLWNLSKPDRHPNIVSVRSLFEIHGTAYMVMDFEGGVSLSKLLKDGRRFDEATLRALITPIALGLERAHRAGVLHRDIKPANILVDEVGRPVLIDFGSARFDSGQATSTKVTFYTPPYAALEQYVKTYPQGPWTDIYALGVTLYECVTGKKPHEVLERLHGDLDEPLSGREWPGFSPTFIRAIDAAMAIRPADRPQSIAQWLRMFDAANDEGDEAVTQIATFREIPVLAATPDPAPAAAALPTDEPPKPKAKALVVAAAGIAVIGGLIGVLALNKPAGGAKAGGGFPSVSLPSITPQPAAAAQAVDGLIESARAAQRPAREIAALTEGRGKLSALSDQFVKLSDSPDAATKTPALLAEIENVGKAIGRAEAVALARDADVQLRDVRAGPGWTGGGAPSEQAAISSVRQAKSKLDDAVAKARAASDAQAAVGGARSALGAYKNLVSVLAASKPGLIAARKQSVAALDATARQLASEISAAGSGSKPWMLASKAQKERYKAAQEQAAVAQARLSELNTLVSATAAANELSSVNSVYTRISAIKIELEGLKAQMATAASQS